MSTDYIIGTKVEWDWGEGTATGAIQERYTSRVEKVFKGTQVVRDASVDEPAYLIKQDDGDEVLKSHSELRQAE